MDKFTEPGVVIVELFGSNPSHRIPETHTQNTHHTEMEQQVEEVQTQVEEDGFLDDLGLTANPLENTINAVCALILEVQNHPQFSMTTIHMIVAGYVSTALPYVFCHEQA